LAQLVRALASHAGGQWFESTSAHFKIKKPRITSGFFFGSAAISEESTYIYWEKAEYRRYLKETELILTLWILLSIGFYGSQKHSFIVDVERMKKYWDLSENEILQYACIINSNYRNYNIKNYKTQLDKSALALKYYKMIFSGECKNYVMLASKLKVSRAWISKVMIDYYSTFSFFQFIKDCVQYKHATFSTFLR
jgi:hypothetical protein